LNYVHLGKMSCQGCNSKYDRYHHRRRIVACDWLIISEFADSGEPVAVTLELCIVSSSQYVSDNPKVNEKLCTNKVIGAITAL
jgi:hypothetical protein